MYPDPSGFHIDLKPIPIDHHGDTTNKGFKLIWPTLLEGGFESGWGLNWHMAIKST